MKILITGSEGVIGKVLREGLRDHDVLSIDSNPGEGSAQADICEIEQIMEYFEGMETVIHLAADKRNYAAWASVVNPNVTGTRNVYEAAHRSEVKRVIFASSLNVYPWTEIFDREGRITEDTIPVAHSDYGLTKLLSEAIGLNYHMRYGINVVNLRLGSVNLDDRPNGYAEGESECVDYAHWLSQRDLVDVMDASLSYTGFINVPCTSANKSQL